jgi:tetratricopeptide (TPR) repeat protein
MTASPLAQRVRGLLVPVALMVASALVIHRVRPGLVTTVTKVRETSSIYPLPPPDQLPVFSLGYRSALADAIWASVMVNQGLYIKQRRRFDFAARYFESIFTLDPTYRHPYLLVETILTFGATQTRVEDVREARRFLELGMRERPHDAQLFLQAGSFMAYLAPSHLPEEERMAWRQEGARLMARAGELGAADSNLQWHALASTRMLTRTGERAAAISFLERIFEVTEDPELRASVLRQLRGLRAEETAERAELSMQRFEAAWREDLPFVSRTMLLLLGPRVDPASCAGPGRSGAEDCVRDWKRWSAAQR